MTARPPTSDHGPPGRIRIVAGSRRGRYVQVPRRAVRPTTEMVREAVFNALGPVGGLTVLDLFAGSGALGLEALSRGAASCVFVEAERSVAVVLRENIRLLDYELVSRIIVADYRKALESLVRMKNGFDLLFVDPPYRILSDVEGSLTSFVPSLLSAGAVVVIESDCSSQVSLGLTPVFARTYGDTKITMVAMRRSLE
jgi:16S rRNA (guanine966-N2)-methyltransferase